VDLITNVVDIGEDTWVDPDHQDQPSLYPLFLLLVTSGSLNSTDCWVTFSSGDSNCCQSSANTHPLSLLIQSDFFPPALSHPTGSLHLEGLSITPQAPPLPGFQPLL